MVIALSIGILTIPVNIAPSLSPIQTIGIFTSLPQFVALFIGWLVALWFLVFKYSPKLWESIALVCVFVLVFVGFWIVKTPYGVGADGFYNLAQVVNPNLGGNPFITQPGIYLSTDFAIIAAQLHNLPVDIFVVAQTVRIGTLIALAGVTFWLMHNILKDSRLAMIAVIMIAVVVGTLSPGGGLVRTTFRPDLLSGVLWVTAMALVFKDDNPLPKWRDRVVVIALIIATAMTYSAHALVLAFSFLGIYLVDRITKRPSLSWWVVAIAVIVAMPFAISKSQSLLGHSLDVALPRVTQSVTGEGIAPSTSLVEVAPVIGHEVREAQTDGGGVEASFVGSIKAAINTPLPWWAILSKYLRWVFFGLGTLLAIIGLARLRKKASSREIAAVIGLLVMSIVMALVSYQGFEYQRYLIYAPIFLAPIIVKWLMPNLRVWLVVALAVLALPSFLSLDAAPIGNEKVYTQEIQAGEFLQERYGDGENLKIFTNEPLGFPPANYYTPKAAQFGTQAIYWTPSKEALSKNLDALVQVYNECEGHCIFVYSIKVTYAYGQTLKISPDDEIWQDLQGELGTPIYSNGMVEVYER